MELRNRKWEEYLTDEEYPVFIKLSELIMDISEDMPFFQIKRIIELIMEYENVEDFTYSILEEESKKEVDEIGIIIDNK